MEPPGPALPLLPPGLLSGPRGAAPPPHVPPRGAPRRARPPLADQDRLRLRPHPETPPALGPALRHPEGLRRHGDRHHLLCPSPRDRARRRPLLLLPELPDRRRRPAPHDRRPPALLRPP